MYCLDLSDLRIMIASDWYLQTFFLRVFLTNEKLNLPLTIVLNLDLFVNQLELPVIDDGREYPSII